MIPVGNDIDWTAIESIDRWLDTKIHQSYIDQPMAQDWARVAKIQEELGEAVAELILFTGQNPRKGRYPEARQRLLKELADTAITAILAMQHFVNNKDVVRDIIKRQIQAIADRAVESGANTSMRA